MLGEGTGRLNALQRGRGPRACDRPSGADLFRSPAGSGCDLSHPRCTRPLFAVASARGQGEGSMLGLAASATAEDPTWVKTRARLL